VISFLVMKRLIIEWLGIGVSFLFLARSWCFCEQQCKYAEAEARYGRILAILSIYLPCD